MFRAARSLRRPRGPGAAAWSRVVTEYRLWDEKLPGCDSRDGRSQHRHRVDPDGPHLREKSFPLLFLHEARGAGVNWTCHGGPVTACAGRPAVLCALYLSADARQLLLGGTGGTHQLWCTVMEYYSAVGRNEPFIHTTTRTDFQSLTLGAGPIPKAVRWRVLFRETSLVC